MPKKRMLIFLLWIICHVANGAEFASMVPFRLEHITPPLNKSVRIELSKVKSGQVEMIYSVTQKGELQTKRGEFSEYVIAQLFEKLQITRKPGPSDWASDPSCLFVERWKIQFGSSRKEICHNSKLRKRIQSFQASAEMLLRDKSY